MATKTKATTTSGSSKFGSSFLDRLKTEAKKIGDNSNRQEDERFWQPEVDKLGNGQAIIRFLPMPANEDVPFVRIWSHGFKGPTGKWYIENSLTTLQKDDPVGEFNSELWAQSQDDESWQRKQVRAQKRKLSYISNILVINDPHHPEHNGKVFLYKYGAKIFDKILSVMEPAFETDTPMNPYDPYEGANFRIKIKKKDGYRNYDDSAFETSPNDLGKTWDEKYEAQVHSLQKFLAPENFKSYDELKKSLTRVLGQTKPEVERDVEDEKEAPLPTRAEKPRAAAPAARTPAAKAADEGESDSDLAMFRKLQED